MTYSNYNLDNTNVKQEIQKLFDDPEDLTKLVHAIAQTKKLLPIENHTNRYIIEQVELEHIGNQKYAKLIPN